MDFLIFGFFRLPLWTKKVFPSKEMSYAAGLSLKTNTYNRKLARLKTGPLLKEILDRFMDKISHKLRRQRSLHMYSAHDSTVANLLNTLKMFKVHSPPYAATVLLEMRQYKTQPLISVFYKTTNEYPKPIEIPGCGIQCPLTKMYELYSDVIPEDWESECKILNDKESPFIEAEADESHRKMVFLTKVGYFIFAVLCVIALIPILWIVFLKITSNGYEEIY